MSLEEFRRQPACRFPDNFQLAHDSTLPEFIIPELFGRNPLRPALDTFDSLCDISHRAEVITFLSA